MRMFYRKSVSEITTLLIFILVDDLVQTDAVRDARGNKTQDVPRPGRGEYLRGSMCCHHAQTTNATAGKVRARFHHRTGLNQ